MQLTAADRASLLREEKNRANTAQRKADARQWLKAFGLAIVWIVLAVAVGSFFAGLRTGAVRW